MHLRIRTVQKARFKEAGRSYNKNTGRLKYLYRTCVYSTSEKITGIVSIVTEENKNIMLYTGGLSARYITNFQNSRANHHL